jgi:formylglycine-generating enzyme required for sulfatase activity
VGSDRYGSWADLTIGTVTQRFRLCPGGAVLIGSPPSESGRGNGETAHRAIIDQPYWLADTECTQALWRTVMGNNPSSVAGDELPVDQVSFQRAQDFLRTAAEKYPSATLRLPSEIEWEAACRAGSRGPYTGGFELRKLAWYRVTAFDRLSAVAGRQPNAYGLFDVHGNVWEWCQEASRSYPPDADGLSVATHAFVYRGGSYADTAEDCRAARRGGNQTGDGTKGVGFRLAVSVTIR